MLGFLSLILMQSAVIDCPTEEDATGRWRIRGGEPSCADLAKEAALKKILPRKVTPVEQRRIISHFDDILVDGPSARWRWGKVVRGHIACFAVNSKNRMGGYSGWMSYSFDLKTGEETSIGELQALLTRLNVDEKHSDICA